MGEKPWVVYLQGGPGNSSQVGNLMGAGPLALSGEGLTTNIYSWLDSSSLLFVDQPVGSGLSYASEHSYIPSNVEQVFV